MDIFNIHYVLEPPMRGGEERNEDGTRHVAIPSRDRLLPAIAYMASVVSILVICVYVLEMVLGEYSTDDFLVSSVTAPILEETIKTCLALIPFLLFYYDSADQRPSFLVLMVLVSAGFGIVEHFTDPGEWYGLITKVVGHVGVSIWIGIVFELFFGYDNRVTLLGVLPSIYLHCLFNTLWFVDPWRHLIPLGSLAFAIWVLYRYNLIYLWTAKSP